MGKAGGRITNEVRVLRFRHGEMTQQELADRVGVTRQTVNAIEGNKYSPSLAVAFRIARVFGVSLEQAFGYRDDADRGRGAVRIEYLADHQELVPELARLHFSQWGHLHPGETLEGRTRRLRESCGRGAIPAVLVALEGAALCGSAMLVGHDMDTRADLEPWLASVYVVSERRHRGIGSALVRRVVSDAAGLGVPELYLYTPDAAEFYSGLGWTVLDRCEYLGEQVVVMSTLPGRQCIDTPGGIHSANHV